MLMPLRRPFMLAAIFSVVLVLQKLANGTAPAALESAQLRPDDLAVVMRGREVYLGHCSSCHGLDLEGQPNWQTPLENGRLPAPPHDETGHTWHHPDQLLFDIVKRGSAAVVGSGYESDMPGYDGVLSDEDIIASLSFIKSQWPENIRRRHDRINRNASER